MIRQSCKALADQVYGLWTPQPAPVEVYAAALAEVGTEAIVFRICEAIW
jgi:hypothetical protein